MKRGEGEKFCQFTSQDLLDNGEIELRSWITLLGAVGRAPAQVLAYEPFYSANMAMAVAYWDLEEVKKTNKAEWLKRFFALISSQYWANSVVVTGQTSEKDLA